MNRYQITCNKKNILQEKWFVPFIIIGDPSLDISMKIIDVLIEIGADALELGIPFSDPLADGPIIQKSNSRALSNNYGISKCFEMIQILRKKHLNIPIGILLYANLIYNQGIKNFYKKCQQCGVDSVLIPDVPIEEYSIFYKIADQFNIDSIFICPPHADKKFLSKLSKYAKGYIYLVSRSGVTGIENTKNTLSQHFIKNVKKYTHLPLLQGFGIKSVQQIQQSINLGVDGVICGSAIINIIEKYLTQPKTMIDQIKNFSLKLIQSTQLI